MEVWREIPGTYGKYSVSCYGRVRSLKCVLKQKIDRGYARVSLYKEAGKCQLFTVHSLVAEAFIGPRPDGAHVNHKSGVKSDNFAENLEYCTPSENMKHAHQIGLQSNQGERHSRSKLTDEKVRLIRQLVSSGKLQSEVATMLGIHQTAVSRANSGKRWGHVSNVMGCDQANNLLVAR